MKKILLADDNRTFVSLVKEMLEDNKFHVSVGTNKGDVLGLLAREEFDLFLLDLNFPYSSIGMEILKYCRENYSGLPVIMISGDASIEGALKATRQGARDFIEKPVKRERMLLTINNVLKQRDIEKEIQKVRKKTINMIGNSKVMQKLYQEIIEVSESEFPILIKGETGSGKDLVARAIHNLSRRSDKSFIDFNCSAVPEELWESELFGHKKGSFTGAYETSKGYLKLADRGTIFMDEIGCMPLSVQPKLLRFLENGVIQQVGSDIQEVDVRVVAASNVELEHLVAINEFRKDLFFRLNVFQIDVPPLREHKEDIPDLASHFLIQDCASEGIEYKQFSSGAMGKLLDYGWQGNVRELKNVVDRSIIYSNSNIINEDDVKRAFQGRVVARKKSLREANAEFEKEFIIKNLMLNNWNISQTANKISVDRSNLYKKIKQYDIEIKKQ
jgi:two-component system, NtrC family, nitrogen regulation response regulator NtrX